MSAFDSGERILPTILGTAHFSFISGFGVSKTGYYTPFMILGAALILMGASFTTTWKVESLPSQWIGYQFIIGAGAGLGIQHGRTNRPCKRRCPYWRGSSHLCADPRRLCLVISRTECTD